MGPSRILQNTWFLSRVDHQWCGWIFVHHSELDQFGEYKFLGDEDESYTDLAYAALD